MIIKVMLADNDADTIKNFQTYIRMSFPDFRVVGCVRNASRFLEELKSLQPNLVVADMRFFGIMGYQTIREAYEKMPDTRFIIYGTYNDAEYIEKVMEFGVVDYMYRPVKPAEFERCLKRATKILVEIERVNAEKDELTADYKTKTDLFKDKFINNLLQGHLSNPTEIKNSLRYFNISLPADYTVFTVKIDRFKKILLTLDEMEKHLLIYKLLLTVESRLKKLPGNPGLATMRQFNAVTAIVGNSISLTDLIAFCEELKSDIATQCRTGVTIGIGRSYKNLPDIAISYREAEAALRYRHYVGFNSIIPLHYVEPLNNITYRYPIEKEETLVYTAVCGEYEYCETLLKRLFQSLKDCGDIPNNLISKIVLDIMVSINRFTDEQRLPLDESFSTFFPTKDILEIRNLDDAYAFMSNALRGYCGHMNRLRSKVKEDILIRAKQYIHDNYHENITPAAVAGAINTTPEFLSNIFKGIEGKSMYEYTISIRLLNAKRLIRETAYNDEIIAEKVGYQDEKHFRSVFKQYEGVFPSEYRLLKD